MENFFHIPVLAKELIEGLAMFPGGEYLDATTGGGGHSELILMAADEVKLVAIDRDLQALNAARERLAKYKNQVEFHHLNFAEYAPQEQKFDGIIADLGVSSVQLDQSDRGFSFRQTATLDMRMDQTQDLTAEEIINHWDEVELARIFYEYGEERLSRRIAKAIVNQRPFTTTTELANTIAYAVPKSYRYGRIHPATRVFQALRIVVNSELASLELFLNQASNWLKPDGIIGIISFHSLEDRIIKHFFRESSLLTVITKKPIIAGDEEIKNNPRARSAKLRFAQRSPLS